MLYSCVFGLRFGVMDGFVDLAFGGVRVLILWWFARFTFLWCYNSFRFTVCVCDLV